MQKFDHISLIYEIIGTQELILVRQGKRVISIPATEVLLYSIQGRSGQQILR